MHIAIIGAGNVGISLGRALGRRGHAIHFGVRTPDKIADLVTQCGDQATASDIATAVRDSQVVILAVPWQAADDAIAAAGDLSGKIVIDCLNPIGWDDGPIVDPAVAGSSAAHKIAAAAPGAHVVKAFSTHGAEFNEAPLIKDVPSDTYICGDDDEAKATVRGLAEELGFHVIDAGPLRNAALLEHMAVLWVHLAFKSELGRNFTFKVLHP